ncbi:MAG: hypothetical protein AAF485_17470 [Chloroflexota bacterium]
MARHREKEYGQDLFDSLECITANTHSESLTLVPSPTKELRKMKKFRFQLLHRWLIRHLEPCRVADIAGGKGLLAHLLLQSGWQATVIDPIHQALPDKYKDIGTGKRIRVAPTETVHRIDKPFEAAMAAQFDLLIGMHAHGCNAKIIDSAAEFGCGFVIFPCCVIDEPFYPRLGVQWLETLADYAVRQGHSVQPFRLNFKGQNIGLYGEGIRTTPYKP